MENIKPIKLSNQYLHSASSRVHAKIKNYVVKIDSSSSMKIVRTRSNDKNATKSSFNIDLPVISEEKLPMIIHKIDALDKLQTRLQRK